MSKDLSKGNLAIALLHYPVYNKHRETVTTAVTNLDIHDISRAARTYGLHRYYLVTPSQEQQDMINRITGHWRTGWGSTYNPDRSEALGIIRIASTLDDVRKDFQTGFKKSVVTVATGARSRVGDTTFTALRESLCDIETPHLLVMGTGWGLLDELFAEAEITLTPIRAAGDYNHLSVRSATAIILDRLLGEHN